MKGPDERERPDHVYWRRANAGLRADATAEIIELENLWFWPGQGPCLDGFYYWIPKPQDKSRKPRFCKRLPIDVWINNGRRLSRPPAEHTEHRGIKLELFT